MNNDNKQYYTPGGNNAYYTPGGNNAYYQAGGNQQYFQDPTQIDSEDGNSNFNPIEWLFTFMHYWYLFVIAISIALGLAMLKNRRWLPTYYSQGTLVIKESSTYGGNSALMRGFGVDAGYKNVNNQMVMLGSYDLMCRVVDSLPFMHTEYITQGRFKTRNLYRRTPIVVEQLRIAPEAYERLFQLTIDDDRLHISSTDEDLPLELDARYGQMVKCPYFDIVIMPTEMMTSSAKIYFRFRSRESLVNEFMGALQLAFVAEGSTVLALSLVSETPDRDCDFIDKLSEIYLLKKDRKSVV